MRQRAVFVHGAGRVGPDAWPAQHSLASNWDLKFPDRVGYGAGEDPRPTDFAGDAGRVIEAIGDEGHLVAHSYGAIAALMAIRERPDAVASLVLFEPACLSLARGGSEVEAHIAAMSPVLARAADLDDIAFEDAFLAALGASPRKEPPTDEALLRARRLRFQVGPWDAPLNWAGMRLPPTVVVTGGWSPLYEEIAQVLVARGARRATLLGHGHRPQDHPAANELLTSHWASIVG